MKIFRKTQKNICIFAYFSSSRKDIYNQNAETVILPTFIYVFGILGYAQVCSHVGAGADIRGCAA